MIDENQNKDFIENVVKKFNAARLNEITITDTKFKNDIQHQSNSENTEEVKNDSAESESAGYTETPRQFKPEMICGSVKLLIHPPVSYILVKKLEIFLIEIDGLRLKSIGGSTNEELYLIVFIEQPIPLLDQLKKIELIQNAVWQAKNIIITLRNE